MEQFALYLALKNIILGLGLNYKISFNYMDINEKNVAGIFVKGAEPSIYRSVASGDYFNFVSRVQILLQGDDNHDSLMLLLHHISKIKTTLIRSCNCVYNTQKQLRMLNGAVVYDPDGALSGDDVFVRLVNVDLLGEVDFKGITSQWSPKYSINFKITYSIQGGNYGS